MAKSHYIEAWHKTATGSAKGSHLVRRHPKSVKGKAAVKAAKRARQAARRRAL